MDVAPRLPRPCYHPATHAYPAIFTEDDCAIGRSFDGLICRVQVSQNNAGQVFPWQFTQVWFEGDKKDFLVPCHEDPDTTGGTVVALAGLSGEPLRPDPWHHQMLKHYHRPGKARLKVSEIHGCRMYPSLAGMQSWHWCVPVIEMSFTATQLQGIAMHAFSDFSGNLLEETTRSSSTAVCG